MNQLSNIVCLCLSALVAFLFVLVGSGVPNLELPILLGAVLYTCAYLAPAPLRKMNRDMLKRILYSSCFPRRKNEEGRIVLLAQFIWTARDIKNKEVEDVVLDMYERQVREKYDPYGPMAMLISLFVLGAFQMEASYLIWNGIALLGCICIPHLIDVVDGFRSPVSLNSLRKLVGHHAETTDVVLQNLSTHLDVFNEWLPTNQGYEVHEFMRLKIFPLMRRVGASWVTNWTGPVNRERFQQTITLLYQQKL